MMFTSPSEVHNVNDQFASSCKTDVIISSARLHTVHISSTCYKQSTFIALWTAKYCCGSLLIPPYSNYIIYSLYFAGLSQQVKIIKDQGSLDQLNPCDQHSVMPPRDYCGSVGLLHLNLHQYQSYQRFKHINSSKHKLQ